LQRDDLVTPLVAILTLAAAAAAEAPSAPSLDGVASVEQVRLPGAAGPLELRVDALGRTLVIEAPRGASIVAQAVRRAPRAVCTGIEEAVGEVRLHCRSNRLVARLVRRDGATVLDVRETRGLPWGSATAAPLIGFAPDEVGLGAECPGSTPEGRAECLIAARDLAGARALLAAAPEGGAAALRRGDFAYAEGDTRAAASHWARAHGTPWDRLAAVRLCELDAGCVGGSRAEALYATAGLSYGVALDLLARRARALAFLDRTVDAARLLLGDATGRAACDAAPEPCRAVALAAVRLPFPGGAEALALWLRVPARDRSSYELELATARAAQQAGAPLFAANVLAGVAGRVPAHALPEHLLWTAELYVEGGDRIRAGVIHEFARARAGKRGLQGARWAAVARALAPQTPSVRPDGRAAESKGGAPDDATILADAARAAAHARALTEGGRP
jgi:hypothetical protein